ncbi:MAG TPA: arginine deiminase-related protein [Puia sp.]|nr:arginine deiminase-related protein [Puia sp.]
MQTTSHILMIRPVNFSFNAETAVNNAFQSAPTKDAQRRALGEFNDFVAVLGDNGVDVIVVDDTPEPCTPDSIFPNNWISFHEKGLVCLYPMFAANRRLERNPGVLQRLGQEFRIDRTLDLSSYENRGLFLEGTGSMVLDRDNKIAYACLSPRTDREVLGVFCREAGYSAELFTAVDDRGMAIYHTNVLMCVADRYVVACLDSLPVPEERDHFVRTVQKSGKKLIPITMSQMDHFAGNMLQVRNAAGESLLVMSSQAFESLSAAQLEELTAYNRILHSPLHIIESNGGGSARCMMAEIHLDPLEHR